MVAGLSQTLPVTTVGPRPDVSYVETWPTKLASCVRVELKCRAGAREVTGGWLRQGRREDPQRIIPLGMVSDFQQHSFLAPLEDGLSTITTSRSHMTRLVCRLQGVQSFHLGFQRRTCLTRASHAGTEDGQRSEKPGSKNKIPSFSEKMVDAVKIFPWEKVFGRFVHRVLDLVWIAMKWLAIPVFALSTLGEFVYTLSAGKDICIPLGILSGVLLAKIIGNASLDVVKELEDGRASWPLIAMGLFFVLLKLPGPYYPSWGAAFLPHVANGGLVQTVFLFRESHRISV